MYPISWECHGGLTAMTKHLHNIKPLELDYVWLSPLYPSPRYDHGYDVSDYMAIDPRFGTMDDFKKFVRTAHRMGIKVLMDLVLNHTSTEHPWFTECPEDYHWVPYQTDKDVLAGWRNLFNNESAWTYSKERGEYYLHLFHEKQADLKWFTHDGLNTELVEKFREIVDFWTVKHRVDGFRLDVPQAINKVPGEELTLETLIFGDRAVDVISAVFSGKRREKLFLMMECLDPTFGELTQYYADNTPVNFVSNILLKDEFPNKYIRHIELVVKKFRNLIIKQTQSPHFMLELESHDAPRFLSRDCCSHNTMMEFMFDTGAQAVCLYQGQELSLKNPSEEEMPDDLMLGLDAQTAMRHSAGESLKDLRPLSRANARIPLSSKELRRYHTMDYALEWTRDWIHYWRDY